MTSDGMFIVYTYRIYAVFYWTIIGHICQMLSAWNMSIVFDAARVSEYPAYMRALITYQSA